MKRRLGLLLGYVLDLGEAVRYGARPRVEEADGPLRATRKTQRAHEAWRRGELGR